jgi:hypothetical protein
MHEQSGLYTLANSGAHVGPDTHARSPQQTTNMRTNSYIGRIPVATLAVPVTGALPAPLPPPTLLVALLLELLSNDNDGYDRDSMGS